MLFTLRADFFSLRIKRMQIFGHEDKIELFKKLIREGNLGHAYLFYGDSEIGKFLFAKSLANFLAAPISLGRASPNFFEVGREGTLLDSRVFTPNEKNSIGIEEARELKSFLWQTPLVSEKRLAIINDCHLLTPEAGGAMLKIAEEPPKHGTLIFITHAPQALFPPLLSRFAKVYFKRMPKERIKSLLADIYKIPLQKAEVIAINSFGRIGRAINLLKGENANEKMNLESEIEEEILALSRKNLIKNAEALSWLLERESLLKRYNLNQNLQKKAMDYEITNYTNTKH